MTVQMSDIEIGLGRTLTASESAQAEQWIGDARMLIFARLGDLDELDQATLDYVVREAVLAQVRRPDDATQVSVSVDDGNVARTYRTGSGRVTILDEWWNLLSGNKGNGGAFTVDTYYGPGGSGHVPWCSLMFGAVYCSCGVDIAGEPIFGLGYRP